MLCLLLITEVLSKSITALVVSWLHGVARLPTRSYLKADDPVMTNISIHLACCLVWRKAGLVNDTEIVLNSSEIMQNSSELAFSGEADGELQEVLCAPPVTNQLWQMASGYVGAVLMLVMAVYGRYGICARVTDSEISSLVITYSTVNFLDTDAVQSCCCLCPNTRVTHVKLETGHSIECITHARHPIAFLHFVTL